ncbi:MAG: AAA family ATPase [Polyangiaceae bacterium]|nr:AAA family ATPase [Polyangiaceae bacterium]
MYVEKIEIPSFRVLHDVVLEFGGVYDTQVVPLGSENGGGKSTALQLIFVLLHCSAEPSRHAYLQNLLASDTGAWASDQKVIARLTIRIGGESYALEFLSLSNRFLAEKLESPLIAGFDGERKMEMARSSLAQVREQLADLEQIANLPAESQAEEIRQLPWNSRWPRILQAARTPQDVAQSLSYEIAQRREAAKQRNVEFEALVADWQRTTGILTALDYKYITTYRGTPPTEQQARALVCRAPHLGIAKVEELLSSASSKVFLLGPSNQQYLFLHRDARKALLKTKQRPETTKYPAAPTQKQRPQIEYLTSLDEAEGAMDGFYAYDWLSVEPLVRLFLSARDEDFKNAVKSGHYGNRYTTLQEEVNNLLFGKKVRPRVNLSGNVAGVEFVITDESGAETLLSPEDLSQGELKRLMIYAWLRANSASEALVLIDEIEASFHPDWQVGIVRDLHEWGPKNQYLLATHSYELCQALTPRHVRELQPRLRRSEASAPEVKEADAGHG